MKYYLYFTILRLANYTIIACNRIYFNSCFKIKKNWRITISALGVCSLEKMPFLWTSEDQLHTGYQLPWIFPSWSRAEHVIGPTCLFSGSCVSCVKLFLYWANHLWFSLKSCPSRATHECFARGLCM